MANDIKRIEIGAATISMSAYVTAGGAGTFTDVGYTEGPATVEPSSSDYRIVPEQVLGAIRSIPTEAGWKLKFATKESVATQMQWIFRQPAGSLTGADAANKTLLFGDPSEEYRQMKLVTKGPRLTATGNDAVQTWTFWRCAAMAIEPIGVAKDKEKILGVTLDILYDESVATADKYFKQVNASAT